MSISLECDIYLASSRTNFEKGQRSGPSDSLQIASLPKFTLLSLKSSVFNFFLARIKVYLLSFW